jgi:HSF-type DNA-binding
MLSLTVNPLMALVNAATSELGRQSAESPGPLISPSTSLHCAMEKSSSVSVSPVPTKKPKDSFAETLMNLLHDDDYSNIVTFLPDGQSFGIINAKVFNDEVMPKVLGIRTFSSFVRKLNRWGFERIMEKKTHDVDVFRHDLFRQGAWAMCRKIKCTGRPSKPQELQREMAPRVIRSVPLTAFQEKMRLHDLSRPSTLPKIPQALLTPSLHDVTSEVVGAALDALRRDEYVIATPTSLQDHLAHQHMQARMMALRHRQLLSFGASPRSSMAML